MPPLASRRVAVIGAGASGLVAARELRREGHRVVVFERGNQLGGTWVYTPEVESDPLGVDPNRALVHTSLYDSLRTCIPREVMGFRDYPFVKRDRKGRDPRRYPGHKEVLMYLQEFASAFEISKLVRLETEVVFAGLAECGKWRIQSKTKGGDSVCADEIYDAVVICNGHYSQPRIAEIPGINAWPGKQMHSHNYRTPEPLQDRVVVVIGSSASGIDISRDIAAVAREVHIAARSVEDDKLGKQAGYDNLWLHSMIDSVHEDGRVVFQDREAVHADFIIHCTGYKFCCPFLETNGLVTVDDNCVGPLYQHVFPAELAPNLSFVGLPWKVVPFPIFEFQSKWIAGILSNRIALPSKEEMTEDVKAFYSSLEASSTQKRFTHALRDTQWDYDDWIARQCGIPGVEEWRKRMYTVRSMNKALRPESYRDEWDDDDLILQAEEDFIKVYQTSSWQHQFYR